MERGGRCAERLGNRLEGDRDALLQPVGGDAHHAGFHFRAAQEVTGHPADSKSGTSGLATFVLPDGAVEGKNATVTAADWIGCKFSIQGHPYLVVHFDHPSNPRPITYSTRPYGRFGAFFDGQSIPSGKPLKLKFRSALATRFDAKRAGRIVEAFEDPATLDVLPVDELMSLLVE